MKDAEAILVISRDCVHLYHDVHNRLVGRPRIRVVVDRRVRSGRFPQNRRRHAHAILVRAVVR